MSCCSDESPVASEVGLQNECGLSRSQRDPSPSFEVRVFLGIDFVILGDVLFVRVATEIALVCKRIEDALSQNWNWMNERGGLSLQSSSKGEVVRHESESGIGSW